MNKYAFLFIWIVLMFLIGPWIPDVPDVYIGTSVLHVKAVLILGIPFLLALVIAIALTKIDEAIEDENTRAKQQY